ncbi:MAG: hypothetical protein GF400_03600 [Candidatus Eisenbacteria bacterium]|nr:hypothetical protein [Candidatus Eisenbacteria bacterium]
MRTLPSMQPSSRCMKGRFSHCSHWGHSLIAVTRRTADVELRAASGYDAPSGALERLRTRRAQAPRSRSGARIVQQSRTAATTPWERLGGFLFRARSATPVILLLVVVFWPTGGGLSFRRGALAAALIIGGEWYRIRAVGVAGKCTRTRGSNVKELVTAGPFARVRNPLYIGNFVLTYGLVVLSKVDWLLWVFPLAFFLQYAAIVAWEERVLSESFGEEYEHYRAHVPAWLPSGRVYPSPSHHGYRKEIALRSERDSLRAVLLLVAVLLLKHFVFHEAIRSLVSAG